MDLLGRTCSTTRMNLARIFARAVVLAGGILWALMLFASNTVQHYSNLTYTFQDIIDAGVSAVIPLAICVVVFVLSLFYETLAALVLLLFAVATVVWGLVADWSGAGIWGLALVLIVLPTLVSAALYVLAARTQRACELEEAQKTAQA